MIYKEKKTQNICMVRRLSILKQPIFSTLNNHLIDYPTPSNLSYWWSFGSLDSICLVIQIITCAFLSIHYTPHVDLVFLSVKHIVRDVKGGWLFRYMHANGANMFFIMVYLHIFIWFVLWKLCESQGINLVSWSCHFIINDYNSFYRIHITVGSIWPFFLLMEGEKPH